MGSFPIFAKISGYDDQKGGMNPAEAVTISKLLERSSCDGIEVSCGNGNFFETARPQNIPLEAMFYFTPGFEKIHGLKKAMVSFFIKNTFKLHKEKEDYNVAVANQIKQSVSIPVIVSGRDQKTGIGSENH